MFFLLVLTITILLLSLNSFASLASYYGIVQNTGTNLDGNFFRVQNQDMDSKWTSAHNTRFILHSTWLSFTASKNVWIECGMMDGAMKQPGESNCTYWKGCYTAKAAGSAYSEYKIVGPSSSNGTYHTYQISRTEGPDSNGRYKWGVYVDYVLRKTYINSQYQYGLTPDVGLETNYVNATSSQWNEHSIQRISSWNWNNWSISDSSLYVNSAVGISASYVNPSSAKAIYTSK